MASSPPDPPASASSAAHPEQKICFNAYCKEQSPKPDAPRRRGWRLRSGEFADLCERCYMSFEQGIFCETFHSEVAGWRNCEGCNKRLHCGCIVSIHAYLLLDAGGVECIMCARKSHVSAPNQIWSSPLNLPQQMSDRKEGHAKNWRPATGPFAGHWRQSNLWSVSSVQSDLQQRLAYEFDRPNTSEKLLPGRTFIHAPDKKYDDMHERMTGTSMSQIMRDRYINGHTGLESNYSYTLYHREGIIPSGQHQDSSHIAGENDSLSTRKGMIPDTCSAISSGFNLDAQRGTPHSSNVPKEDLSSLPASLSANILSPNGLKESGRITSTQSQGHMASSLHKQFYPHNVIDGEMQSTVRTGRPRMDAKQRAHLLPRYWPRITDQELQKISGDTNSVITPLFEKMLSASDAGRIGRLVLPKKCAEAYFPTISQPEGLPLKVQDANGKDWVFQFRFWPNNNSRMYVLEGVTPCIQSMQLQAGDTVTFSRIDPEGKLIMGFRKASNISSAEQDVQTGRSGNGASMPLASDADNKAHVMEPNLSTPAQESKDNIELKSVTNAAEQASCTEHDGTNVSKEGHAFQSPQRVVKRKCSAIGSKIKRLKMEKEDSAELKITWEEAQELLRPPPNSCPSVVKIDGHEFEEYTEPPLLGRRTLYIKSKAGETHQWAQCEDCTKWRKLPVNVILPFRWTCSDNKWDTERSSCSSSPELSVEQLAELLPTKSGVLKRSTRVKMETSDVEASAGLDALANIAILGEGEPQPGSSQATTTKHPRHRPGCLCIVCIQPPSGKGPKHKPNCNCNVCITVRRRFKTLMLRRHKRQPENDAEATSEENHNLEQLCKAPSQSGSGEQPACASTSASPQNTATKIDEVMEEVEEITAVKGQSLSPIKNQIDLNIQPEREDSSPNQMPVA